MGKTLLITGSDGQLGSCIKDIRNDFPDIDFHFANSSELDITSQESVNFYFGSHRIDWCINCAAYTAVDKAEADLETAQNVNVIGANNLAVACKKHQSKLIHISTDFVFDGQKNTPYGEEDVTNALGVYGKTKLKGENKIKNNLPEHFIVRTSWLYSEHGNNFLKTMLRLGSEREALNVVGDQVGTPTYAGDLAETLMRIIIIDSEEYGIYHYSNEGVASWYDFAKAIFDLSGLKIKLGNIPSSLYPTPAKRPNFSVLDKSKIKKNLEIEIPYWRDSLQKAINKLQ